MNTTGVINIPNVGDPSKLAGVRVRLCVPTHGHSSGVSPGKSRLSPPYYRAKESEYKLHDILYWKEQQTQWW